MFRRVEGMFSVSFISDKFLPVRLQWTILRLYGKLESSVPNSARAVNEEEGKNKIYLFSLG